MGLAERHLLVTEHVQNWLGGVRVNFRGEALSELPIATCVPTDSRQLAHLKVDCKVRVLNRTIARLGGAPIAFQPRESGLAATVGEDELRISRESETHFVARATVRSGALSGVASAVASAALHLAGGFVIHAAVAEVDGRAVAFIGPSGAGKTTAVELLEADSVIAIDRAAVIPTDDGWSIARMPGGGDAPAGVPLAKDAVRPLAAVACVQQGSGRPNFRSWAGMSHAVARVRSSVLCPVGLPEEPLLSAVAALVGGVPVGEVTTVLGESLALPLASWLGGASAAI